MASSMKTILVIGGTSGIGEAFVKRFHKMGKKVITTGRRVQRLQELQKTLPGLEIYEMDNTKLDAIPKHVDTLFSKYKIDSVLVNSGIMLESSIKDPSTSSDKAIFDEINVNLIAPITFARNIIPRLLEKAPQETQFMITSSGLGYTFVGQYGVYCATKAGAHAYMYTLRQQLKDSNVNVIEIVPPKVETDLFNDHKMPGGPAGISLEQMEKEFFEQLESTPAKELKEVRAGSTFQRVGAWREGPGKLMQEWKMTD